MNRKLLWSCLLFLALLLAMAAGGAAFADGSVYEIKEDTFSTYFNEDGTTKDTIGDDCPQLVFSGTFSDKPFVLDKPMTVTADPEALPVLTDSRIAITAEGVTVDGLTLNAQGDHRNLIDVQNSNVTVRNMTISYTTDSEGCALNVGKAEFSEGGIIEGGGIEDVVIQDNTIVFETSLTDNRALAAAINVENAEGVSVSGNTVTATLPVMQDRISSVRLYGVSESSFTDNSVTATVISADRFNSIAVIMTFASSEGILIQGNTVSATEAAVTAEAELLTVGVYCISNTGLVFKTNRFDFSGADENDNDRPLRGFWVEDCTAEMIGNTIRCDANRPVSGVYFTDGTGPNEVTLQDNEITVSGYVETENSYYSVSCIENCGGAVVVKGSTLRAANKCKTYDDKVPVAGIILPSDHFELYCETSFDIQNNDIFTNGHYAVNIGSAITSVTVTGNRLGAAALGGDDAVYYVDEEADDVLIENNTPAVAPPTFSPAGGAYAEAQNVALSCLTPGAVIHYTVNGDEPTAESPVYAQAIPVSETVTIKAIAIVNDMSSAVSSARYVFGAVVTPENFFDYFDEYGNLLDSVTAQQLILEGEFGDSLPNYLCFDRPITVAGSPDVPAVLTDMGIIITSDGVTLDGLTLTAEGDLGNLIDIYGSNVAVRNMEITYVTSDSGCAVSTGGPVETIFDDVDDDDLFSYVVIEDNTISFETTVDAIDEPAAAINLAGVRQSVLRRNKITAAMPALLDDIYENEYYVMGLSFVTPLRIRTVRESEITGNKLRASLNGLAKIAPTFEAMFIGGCSEVLIQGNSVSIADTYTPEGNAVYLYGAECVYSEEMAFKGNSFDVSTGGCISGYGMAVGLMGISCDMEISGNTIRCDANGPAYGIYLPSRMGPPCDLTAKGNTIAVSGDAADSDSAALFSGMELETADAEISGNTITVRNKNTANSEVCYVAGISCFRDKGSLDLIIEDNSVLTNGQYAVSFDELDDATVTGNRLSADWLSGDEAVYIGSGSRNTVENNTGYAEPVFSPAGGLYAGAQNVTISSPAKGAVIYYTLNGDRPTSVSAVYAEAIPVSETTMIRAFAVVDDFWISGVSEALYVIGSEDDLFANADFVLPADLAEVEEEAFAGVSATTVVVPDSCAAIGAHAFRGCQDLTMIRIPAACTVGEDAFADCEQVYVFGYAGSSAESYCEAHANCVFVALTE